MSISAGTHLGSYELGAQIGAGGMGEVYQAHDTKLGRDVAIKILPEAFAHDAERLARFQREAKMLAALNHPNIATIHGLEQSNGTSYLVMELIPGETLADRIKRDGQLPVEEALKICAQIAEALEAAHEKGIIHRDLKPANVKVTPEGKVKVLDFGLAKAVAGDVADSNSSQSPTLSAVATMQGVLLGTAGYMSPEQARGKTVNKATDIWAFGCLLYELLCGHSAFEGEDVTEILAAVVKTEPDWNRLPANTPPAIRVLLRRCLRKDKRQRFQDATDVRIEIDEALTAPLPVGPTIAKARAAWRWALAAGLACLIVAVTASIATWNLKPISSTGQSFVSRFAITLPPSEKLVTLAYPAIALSTDGKQLVYIAGRGGIRQLFLRSMDSLESKPVSGTEGAFSPFFSPDGQWVGFFADGKLKKVAVTGGSSVVLCDAAGAWGGSWAEDDTIFFARGSFSPLWKIATKGGVPQPFTKLESQKGEVSHRWPQVLPGGKAVLFTVWTGPGWDEAQVQLQIVATGERRVLIQGGHTGYYVPTGHLVYHDQAQQRLMAVTFNLARLQVGANAPVAVAEGVSEGSEGAQYSFSASGSLAYVPSTAQQNERTLVWVDRNGENEALAAPPGFYFSPQLSPDSKQVALWIQGGKTNVWLYNPTRDTFSRLTSDSGGSQAPIWTPDGKRLTYRATHAGTRNLFWRLADDSAAEERLTTGEGNQNPGSWSPDGQVLAFVDNTPATGNDIWILRLNDRKQQPFLRTPFNEGLPSFSPDGQWLAYNSDESGRYEIYVRPFPGPGGKWQISTGGGTDPIWNRNGRELFYRSDDKVMAAEVTSQPGFAVGKTRMLFGGQYIPGSGGAFRSYDVSGDGQRFLMLRPAEQQKAATQINVVLNWFEELKQKVPTGTK